MDQAHTQTCQEWVPQLAAHALGEPADAALQAHLQTCERCRAELASFGRVARVLPYTAPPVAPPPLLRERILDAAAGRAPAAAARKPGLVPRLRLGWPTFAWAAIVGLLLGWNLALNGQLRAGERSFGELQARLAATQNQLSAAQAELNTAMERLVATTAQIERSRTNWGIVTVLFNSPDLQVVPINADGAAARVWFTPSSSEACFVAQGLPDPGAGKVYQIWLNQGDTKISGGTFRPVGDNAWIVLRADRPVASFGTLGITIEPAGGSPAPTTPPVLRGPIT